MLWLAGALASRRPLAIGTAIGTRGRAVLRLPRSNAKSPNCSLYRRTICGLPGVSRIALAASWPQSRSADPNPCPSAARARRWRGEPGTATALAEPNRRVRETGRARRSRSRAEDRHEIGAAMAPAAYDDAGFSDTTLD